MLVGYDNLPLCLRHWCIDSAGRYLLRSYGEEYYLFISWRETIIDSSIFRID